MSGGDAKDEVEAAAVGPTQGAVEAPQVGDAASNRLAENPQKPERLLTRFSGEAGSRLLKEQLLSNSLVRGNEAIADALISVLSLVEFGPGESVLTQGDTDNDLYLILSGHLSVSVNGREVARRTPGSHVGEMSLVDAAALRAASICAVGHALLAKIPEPRFERVATAFPEMWRRLAIEISRRLHERSALLKPPRELPVVFIGCSTESQSLSVAQEIQFLMQHDKCLVQIWTDGVFNASKTPIEDLDKMVREVDFGIVVLTPDDKLEKKEKAGFSPRDNVIFELGMLVGALGRERTFMVMPRGVEMHIPSDLTGVTPITYADGDPSTLRPRIGPVCTEIRNAIRRLGSL